MLTLEENAGRRARTLNLFRAREIWHIVVEEWGGTKRSHGWPHNYTKAPCGLFVLNIHYIALFPQTFFQRFE